MFSSESSLLLQEQIERKMFRLVLTKLLLLISFWVCRVCCILRVGWFGSSYGCDGSIRTLWDCASQGYRSRTFELCSCGNPGGMRLFWSLTFSHFFHIHC